MHASRGRFASLSPMLLRAAAVVVVAALAVAATCTLATTTTDGGTTASNVDSAGCLWEWQYTPCSAPCDGGTFSRHKVVLSRPDSNATCEVIANQTSIPCNTFPCSATGDDQQQYMEDPELRVSDGNIIVALPTTANDLRIVRGSANEAQQQQQQQQQQQESVGLFSDIMAQLSALQSTQDTILSRLSSVQVAMSQSSSAIEASLSSEVDALITTQLQASANASHATASLEMRVASNTASIDAAATSQQSISQLASSLSQGVQMASVSLGSRLDDQEARTAGLLNGFETITTSKLPSLQSQIVSTADMTDDVDALATQLSTSIGDVSSVVAAQPRFSTYEFGRQCSGSYYFTDVYGTTHVISDSVTTDTVVFDQESRTGFAFFPSDPTQRDGAMWYLAVEGGAGISCQIVSYEDDAIRGYHFLTATDNGNSSPLPSLWGMNGPQNIGENFSVNFVNPPAKMRRTGCGGGAVLPSARSHRKPMLSRVPATLLAAVLVALCGVSAGLLEEAPEPPPQHRISGDALGNLHINTSNPETGRVIINGIDVLQENAQLRAELSQLRQDVMQALATTTATTTTTTATATTTPTNPLAPVTTTTRSTTSTATTATSPIITSCDAITAVRLQAGASAIDMWRGGVLYSPKDTIYAAPFDATSVLMIRLAKSQDGVVLSPSTTLDITTISDLSGAANKWSASVLLDDRIYGIPFRASDVLVINPVNNVANTVSLPGELQATSNAWSGAGVLNNKIYCIPHSSSTNILVLTPTQGGPLSFSLASVDTTASSMWFGATQLSSESIIGWPYQGNQFIGLQATGGTDATISTHDARGTSGLCSGAVAFNRAIGLPCMPNVEPPRQILRIAEKLASGQQGFNSDAEQLPDDYTGPWRRAASVNDVVVGMPYFGNTLLVVMNGGLHNSDFHVVDVAASDGQGLSFGGAVAVGDYIFAIPAGSPFVLIVDTSQLMACL
ncbi:hypothetical protein PTSG_08527 [Salpingoeca rosetta]|uniref:Uncharacterized protein n=1 Tax=Salpingoeca rosetta (strain ATCC 50818 / BSB-021) TaxID=946362 RepID=F2UJY1_SALR5|nr:uncharacterized protein PTSG_08527 [Salpingoeca rosetta]EGD77430.1 hypothetical protein PTSG_08527 [Salpingoeca rosetta]|eukprot:XP_004990318.1 hypothetical protein PTSG_08527 [Salpingoeca rosetta]